MVDAKWSEGTRHYEARVMREKFGNSLGRQILSQEDEGPTTGSEKRPDEAMDQSVWGQTRCVG